MKVSIVSLVNPKLCHHTIIDDDGEIEDEEDVNDDDEIDDDLNPSLSGSK